MTPASEISKRRFQEAKDKIIGVERPKNGIGTLSEKTTHAVLKSYLEPEESRHEIRIDNFVADIFTGNEIIEIQSRGFNTLRKKLDVFLAKYPVTIVYPIPYTKWLFWIDEETGEVTKRRKSPKLGRAFDVFPELYKIKSYLRNENLNIKLIFINIEEYRLLNGWSDDKKRGSERFDRIPFELVGELELKTTKDYSSIIPESLESPFISKEFKKAAKISDKTAWSTLNILYHMGALDRIGKKGNAFLYSLKCNN